MKILAHQIKMMNKIRQPACESPQPLRLLHLPFRVEYVLLGIYPILSVLPDKFARFLFEFHSVRFESLDLPPLPADRSNFDVHGALEDDKVKICKGLYYTYYDIYMYYIYYSWISCQIR